MGVRIRSRNWILHLVYRAGGRQYEETKGLRESDVPEQNREVMRLAEILRSRKEVDLARMFNGLPTAEGQFLWQRRTFLPNFQRKLNFSSIRHRKMESIGKKMHLTI